MMGEKVVKGGLNLREESGIRFCSVANEADRLEHVSTNYVMQDALKENRAYSCSLELLLVERLPPFAIRTVSIKDEMLQGDIARSCSCFSLLCIHLTDGLNAVGVVQKG